MFDAIKSNTKLIFKSLIIVGCLVAILWLQGRYIQLTPEAIQEWVLSYGWYAFFVFLLLALIRPLVFFPITVYYLASGLAFGAIWGGVIACSGAIISAYVAHAIAYKTGTRFISASWAERITTIKNRIEMGGFRNIVFIRLIPLVSFDIISYAGGLARLQVKTFLLATLLGTAPRIFAYTFVGASVLEVNSHQFWLAIAALILLFVVPLLVYNGYQNKFKSR